ncbi:MAG TPA: polysaccharide biosynthesis tyrosine autokinase [Acetobacteraceae bacterium]|nr:polysaccharide biosynthesis tyrosine autokinase [Acetobacteraceae bacterium]
MKVESGDTAISRDIAVPEAPSPIDVLLMIRRRWRLVCMAALLLPALAAFALSRLPSSYRATGTLLYAPVDFAPKLLQGVLVSSPGSDAVMASQNAIILSLPVIEGLIQRLHLADHPEFNPALSPQPAWRRWLGIAHHPKPASAAAITNAVRQALSVATLPNSRVIEVSFTSASPILSTKAANLAMRLYLDRQRTQNFESLAAAQSWLSRRAGETSVALEATSTAIARAQAQAGLEHGSQGLLTSEAASRMTGNVIQAENDLAIARAKLAAAQGGDDAGASAAISSELMPLRTREAELAAKLSALSASEGPNYPDIATTRQELAAERSQINAEMGRIIAADHAQVAADEARLASLRAVLARTKSRYSAEAVDGAPITGLEQKADAERALLRALTKQIGMLASQGALVRPDATILSEAVPPLQPNGPHAMMITLGAGLLGLCLGLLMAISKELANHTFRSGSDIRAQLALPCIALLPELPKRTRRGLSIPEYASGHPFSLFAEQLRALRASVWMDPTGPRILAITAARPGEGKTTLALGLAASAASSGLRTLAIDCDIRQPSFDAAFSLGGALGLTDYLADRATLDQVIQVLPETGLNVVPAGSIATDALSLFISRRMSLLMSELRERYDLVLLDLPPTFALAETRVLARAADATLFCVRWDDTPRKTVSASLALLHEAEIHLIGAVLTRVDAAKHRASGFPAAEIYHPRYGGYFHA